MTEMFPFPITEFPGDDDGMEVMVLDHDDVVEFVACAMYNATDPTFGWGLLSDDEKEEWLVLADVAVEAVALLIAGPGGDEDE